MEGCRSHTEKGYHMSYTAVSGGGLTYKIIMSLSRLITVSLRIRGIKERFVLTLITIRELRHQVSHASPSSFHLLPSLSLWLPLLSLSSFLHFLPMSCHFCCPSSFTTSFSTTQSTTNSNFVWASAKLLGQTTCVKLTGTLPQLWSSRLYTYTYDLWCVCVWGGYFIVLFHIYAIFYFDLESAPYFYTLYSIYGNYNSVCVCVLLLHVYVWGYHCPCYYKQLLHN